MIEGLRDRVVAILRTCFDPEIPVNVYDLGLIYDVRVDESALGGPGVGITMTLTSPGCPVAGSLVAEIETKLREIPGVGAVSVNLVWEPPWTTAMMSEGARLELGL